MKRGIWVSLFVLFVYFLSYAGIQHSIDELATVSLAESILHGSINVNRMEWEQERYPPQNAYGLDDNIYSKKGLGSVLLSLPFLLVGKYWQAVGSVQLVFLTSALITAVTVFIFYYLVCSLNYSKEVATLAALALGLGTMLWPYSQMLFSEPVTALGVAMALAGAAKLWHTLGTRWLFLCGAGSSIIILSRSANTIMVLPFLVALAYRLFKEWQEQKNGSQLLKTGIAFALPIGITVIALVLYNEFRFGTLLSHPRVAGEAFTTPLWTGVSGQLWSSGKGLIFYVPLTLIIIVSFLVDFRKMTKPIYLVAFFVVMLPVFFYGKWFDWPGGKAWGPRFLVPVMPALVLLCVPAINWLNVSRPKWRRFLLAGWLLLTFLAQLPGVLVNFEYQESLDGKAGATYQNLLWNWANSPLLTYWNKVFSGSANPVWLHSFFWDNAVWLLVFIGLLIVAIIAIHIWLVRSSSTNLSWSVLGALGVLTLLLGFSIVAASQEDIRWHEQTESIETNREVRAFIRDASSKSDIVLLELKEDYDRPGRIWEWLNEAALSPDYIGFKRKPEFSVEDMHQLQDWLTPYPRVWLVLQATSYAAPESTTENWLRSWAYEGQNQWIGSQRVVEYLVPTSDQQVIAAGTAVFQTDPPIHVHYKLVEGQTPASLLLDLEWEGTTPGLSYSVQSVNEDQTQILQQIDKPIAYNQLEKVGLFLQNPNKTLLLKVYDPATQTIYSLTENINGTTDHLSLLHEDGR